mgnify:CR=1 FL=1
MKATKFIYKVIIALLVSAQLFAATGCKEKSGSVKPASEKDFNIELSRWVDGLSVEYKGKNENLVVPSTIQDKPVLFVKIYDDKSKIKSLVIPEGVKGIDVTAYGLKNIQLPSTLIYIDLTSDVEEIEIPNGVVDLRHCSSKSLKSLTIPEGVKYLGDVGYECNALESVTLPKSLRKIYYHAFVDCDNLKEINIPEEGLFVYFDNNKPDMPYTTARDCFTGKIIDNSVELQETLKKIKVAGDEWGFRDSLKEYGDWYYSPDGIGGILNFLY